METIKQMTFEERKIFNDSLFKKTAQRISGLVVVKDAATGEILLTKKNLVVRSGRETSLRKIFNIPDTINSESESMLKDKSVLLFGLGTGGAPSSDPFSPFAPSPADTELNSPIPFVTSSASNPLSSSDTLLYSDYRTSSGNTFDWFKKTFSNGKGELTVDPSTDEVYMKLQLQISASEVRDKFVNELGLYWAKYNASGSDQNAKYSSYKLFSRITFLTEPFPSNTAKAIDIDYYIFL